jgi:hypothetical protein
LSEGGRPDGGGRAARSRSPRGRLDEAEQLLQRALAIHTRLFGERRRGRHQNVERLAARA